MVRASRIRENPPTLGIKPSNTSPSPIHPGGTINNNNRQHGVSTYLALSGTPGQQPRPRKASAKHHLSQPPPPPLPNHLQNKPH
ncbi:hypothetical protein QL285_001587 [Trifolium repens]|nr:hypothetical protein QL285_001587 [Trifolium repens]